MATAQKTLLDSVPKGLFIGGSWRDATGGATLAVEDPSSGATLAHVADAIGRRTASAALDAAVAAQAAWAATPPRDRGEILRAAFERITERADDFATLMTLEMGKTLAESRGEVTYGGRVLPLVLRGGGAHPGRWSTAPNGATRLLTMKKPVGPTLMITPWNFPLAMGTRKIGPAIAAGCTMVVKPASQTPLTMLAAGRAAARSAACPRACSTSSRPRTTGDVMEPLIRDPRLRKLTFTGSTGIGRGSSSSPPSSCCGSRWSSAATRRSSSSRTPTSTVPSRARCSPRCATSVRPAPRPTGSTCTSPSPTSSREKFAARMAGLTLGKGTKKGVDVGPAHRRQGP